MELVDGRDPRAVRYNGTVDVFFDVLVVGKLYLIVPAEPKDGEHIRVVDESGEDYL